MSPLLVIRNTFRRPRGLLEFPAGMATIGAAFHSFTGGVNGRGLDP